MSHPLRILLCAAALVTVATGCASYDGNGGPYGDQPGPASDDGVYVVRDNGILCITYPCFSIDALPVDPPGELQLVSDVDLRPLELTQAQIDTLLARKATPEGITVAGHIETVRDAGPAGDGRVLRVARVIKPDPIPE